jgi:uncharacterized protein YcaQ
MKSLTLSIRQARRLALARAGLLKPGWTDMPDRAVGRGQRVLDAAQRVIGRFGYLQLDTVSIAGARSHVIFLLSRLLGFDPSLGEQLLRPGVPLFEYWGHEASWIPLDLYPLFGFRRREFRTHPWWGDVLAHHPRVAARLRHRIREEGPLLSIELEGRGSRGWWDQKTARQVASAMWSSGDLAIRERRKFQRVFDLAERVIPDPLRGRSVGLPASLDLLLLKALEGHGWASTRTLASTWRLTNRRDQLVAALHRLTRRGEAVPCSLVNPEGPPSTGWIRPADLDLAFRLDRIRPGEDRGVLLSPFDPLLWDRARVRLLFGFDQVLEIYKPAPKRRYGYYCLPVLAGERLVARYDLKADRKNGRLRVLSCVYEGSDPLRPTCGADGEAARSALQRYAVALGLEPVW